LRHNGRKYWNNVKFRREKQQEAIRIVPARNERVRRAEELLPPPGSPPFAYRAAYEAAGWRPIAPHEHQMSGLGRHWPKDVEKECQSPRQGPDWIDYAREVRNLELRDIRRQMAWQRRDGVWREGSPNQLSYQDWETGGYHVKVPRPFQNDDDLLLLRRILARSPGRPPGRPPIGERAMTEAERQAKRRAKWQKPKPASATVPH
jgi:hypothetical protein